MSPRINLYYDDAMLDHDMGAWHPERPERLRAIRREVARSHANGRRWVQPRPAADEDILRIHRHDHVKLIAEHEGRHFTIDPDTSMSPGSARAAYLAAGGAIQAMDDLFSGEAERTFCLVRPPGHHAERTRAMGFCLFNNIAIAAAYARATKGIERVLIVDWDVHHGNGTQHAFEERDDVLFFSSHQYPFFPGSGGLREVGRGDGLGYTVNAPLRPGMGDGDLESLYEEILVPIADAYRPELVLVSAGYDAHVDDPLGGMHMTEGGYAVLAGIVRNIADRHAGGKVGLFLEGGYDLDGLARSVRATLEVMAGNEPPPKHAASPRGSAVIDQVREVYGNFWEPLR